MILNTSFTVLGKEYKLALDTKKLDRDYYDEHYVFRLIETDDETYFKFG